MTGQNGGAYSTEDQRWEAVRTRDPRAEGAFLYAVETTGVFCRPGCPSRPPRRENVRFFATAPEAVAAGFRACKRCRPGADPAPEPVARAIERACALIHRSEEVPQLEQLAAAAGMSPSYFHRLFTRELGVTPAEYASARRRARLQEALRASPSVAEAVFEAGFGSGSRVYERSEQLLGMPPARYRRGGEGERIAFATCRTSLGCLLVAATHRGICAIALGDDPDSVAAELRERFPRAELVREEASLSRLLEQTAALVERPAEPHTLPLDIRGTAFQQRVWRALQGIAPGRTLTYSELAVQVGCPTGPRAVARACATNPLAVAVPCHRVVGATGELRGYRWGLRRKRELLDREARAGEAPAPPRPGPVPASAEREDA